MEPNNKDARRRRLADKKRRSQVREDRERYDRFLELNESFERAMDEEPDGVYHQFDKDGRGGKLDWYY
tara:strand:- start:3641 stop:3844 length:204 start_codon:yes stop_codon:yes gene_type:complete